MPTKEKPVIKNTLRQDKPENSKKKSKKSTSGKAGFWGFFKDEKLHVSVGVFLILFSAFTLISCTSYLINYFSWVSDSSVANVTLYDLLFDTSLDVQNWGGRLGAALSWQIIKQGFGIGTFFIVIFMIVAGIRLTFGRTLFSLWRTLRLCVILLVWISLTMGFFFHNNEYSVLAGVFGVFGYQWLEGFMGQIGTGMLLFFILIMLFVFTVNLSLKSLVPKKKAKPLPDNDGENRWFRPGSKNTIKEDKYNTTEYAVGDADEVWNFKTSTPAEDGELTPKGEKSISSTFSGSNPTHEVEFTIEQPMATALIEENGNNGITHYTIDTPYDPTLDLASYVFPTTDLLDDFSDHGIKVNREELEENKNRIVQTLGNYGIKIEKIKATIGPAVTLYEIIPAPGVRIARIKNLEDDIALSLSAIGIRIIAPIPGKGTIGIEVPNQNPEIVSMKSIFTSDKFQFSKYELPFGMGKTISNESYVADLTRMPHILMAGATGQGKSVGLNAIITSLLYKKHPSQVKFVMIDPKKVEL
ncbi:MAG: DNA translocase FtsK 4TM domain-containing protein, partial [Bacteroidales bacterium]|nr:DNA translocase FtsK 4TM domain-containing protein [Bacteroidales bacterium]